MNRQLAKKRLLELEQQAAELQRRKRQTGEAIQAEEIMDCYRWLLLNECLKGEPNSYHQAVENCAEPHPNKYLSEIVDLFTWFNSNF